MRFGLLKKTDEWFEFSHQLLFEETLFTQTSNQIATFQFPSVALRKLPQGSGKDLLRREAEKARVHWTGAALSYHPGIGSAENADWNLWIEEAYKRMTADGVTISQDQLVQTHEILSRFWKHGEAFDKWFQSKVIIVQS